MEERFSFADSETGLTLALLTTLSLRRHGFKTRLETSVVCTQRFFLHTVVAQPPVRPTRAERGASLGRAL